MKRERTQREALRGKLHMILGLVADQVEVDKPDGGKERWPAAKWKRVFKAGYGIKGSTERLADDVYLQFVWWVETRAVERMGVVIPELEPA
jgi:hypothetical protein